MRAGATAPLVQVGMQAVLQAPEAVAAAGAASVVLAPALEELLWRSFQLPSLTRRLPVPAAVKLLPAACLRVFPYVLIGVRHQSRSSCGCRIHGSCQGFGASSLNYTVLASYFPVPCKRSTVSIYARHCWGAQVVFSSAAFAASRLPVQDLPGCRLRGRMHAGHRDCGCGGESGSSYLLAGTLSVQCCAIC